MTTLRHRPSGAIATTILALLFSTSTVTALEGQDTIPVPATMLRVLAEAADGARTGRPVFFVADRRFPHQVFGPFGSRDQALTIQADSGSNFSVFGPYATSPRAAADTTSRVTGIRITMMTPRGRQVFEMDPRKVDAVFLSDEATDKFVIPYYSHVYGPQYAETLRDRLDHLMIVRCHIRPSYLCTPRPDGFLAPIRVMEPGTAPY